TIRFLRVSMEFRILYRDPRRIRQTRSEFEFGFAERGFGTTADERHRSDRSASRGHGHAQTDRGAPAIRQHQFAGLETEGLENVIVDIRQQLAPARPENMCGTGWGVQIQRI